MTLGTICNRSVVTTTAATPLDAAAALMRERHVGCLVVVAADGKPEAVITDRDIVVEVVAKGLDPRRVKVGEIVTRRLVCVAEDQPMHQAMHLMRAHGIRRLPVVGADGRLAGIVTVDDLTEFVADQLGDLAKMIGREQSLEARARP